MDRFYIPLENRSVLAISGEDRKIFLQGIITNDINKVNGRNALYTCILTPQGKFLFDLFVAEQGEILLLDIEKSRGLDLQKKLAMYKLRSKVEISEIAKAKIFALVGKDSVTGNPGEVKISAADGLAFIDPRDKEMGARAMVIIEKPAENLESQGYQKQPYQFYDDLRISCGIPIPGIELIPEKSFPLQNNLDELHAIDFAKGCYVGQEVTTRTKHQGVVRKKLYKLEILDGRPVSGDLIEASGKKIGEMKSVGGKNAIGLLEVEEVGKIQSEPVISGNSSLRIV